MKQPDYEKYARFYDYFELAGYDESEELNIFLDELFNLNSVKTVVDFACGTGAQSIGLARKGYEVTASDKSKAMIQIAREKAEKHGDLPLSFFVADMIDANFGSFDAAICIFNAIGHLNSQECESFFKNVYGQLKAGGLFIVDIFNFTALQAGSFDDYSYLSRELVIDGQIINHVRNCELDQKKQVIRIKSMTRVQDGSHKATTISDDWEMKVYQADKIQSILEKSGFDEIVLFGPTGTEFEPEKSDCILAVCQK